MKPFVSTLLFVISFLTAFSQTNTQYTYYTVDDGLSENTVLSMLQDNKGQMWFGTYDGLNKFDGYTFKTYKGSTNNKQTLLHYRIDRIREDRDGYLWIQTYDGRTYRFDSRTETFLMVPQCMPEYKDYRSSLTGITTLKDGSVWITGGNFGEDDCFRVVNTKDAHGVKISHFNTSNRQLTSNKVNKLYLDKHQNTWILTSNGLNLLKKNASGTLQFFKERTACGFSAICECSSYIYIGGERGRFLMYDSRKETFEGIMTPSPANIIDFHQVNAHELFILTDSNGFYLFDLITHKFSVFNQSNGCGLQSNLFSSSYLDKQHNIWLNADDKSVVYFETGKRKISNFNVLSDKSIPYASGHYFSVLEDRYNNIWVHLKSGVFCRYNRLTNRLDPFYNAADASERKFSSVVRSAMTDRQGNLWLCPSQGVVKAVFRKSIFSFDKPKPSESYSDNNHVRSLFQDKDNWLWVGTKEGLLFLYDEKRNLIGCLGADGRINSSNPLKAPIYNIMSDHTGSIWLSTKGNGLIKVIKKGTGRNVTFSFTNYRYNPGDLYSLSSDAVYDVFEDHLHRLWIATYGGGINLIETQNGQLRFINYRNKLKDYPYQKCSRTRYLTEDHKGRMYVGTTEGLVAFQCDNRAAENIRFHYYTHNPEDSHSISGNDVHYILPAKDGNLYLGVYGGGLNVLVNGLDFNKKPQFISYMKKNGAPSDVVFTLQEDRKGDVWLSTQTKIVRFIPGTEKFDVYSPVTSSIYSFMEAAVCKTRQGELVYGTTDGFVWFNPQKAVKSHFVPQIMFTQLQLLNKTMEVGAEDSPLSGTIDDTPVLKLTHKQNVFSISFAALDYADPKGIQYAYKLEGIDVGWNYVGNQRIATYTNLPKGKYTFKVRSTNADGEWVQNERSIVIERLPSFWESAWGILFYLFVLLVITVLASYVLFTFYRLKNDVAVEHRITNMKLRFFTDISHELRTPLTLIASPVENILQKETLSEKVKEQLEVVQRNTDRMLRLINQILDFRKIQGKKMKLMIEDIPVGQYVNEICLNFQKLAEERHIDFRIDDHSDHAHLWVDKDKFEKIFFNLLSNAFKFTLPGNSIQVLIKTENDSVSITVTDRGIGIGKDVLKQLFNRFESFASSENSLQASSGIGLSLTKELVELHKATIEVESEPGKGSSFRVTFKKGHEHFDDKDEYVLQDFSENDLDKKLLNELQDDAGNETVNSIQLPEIPTILIVEDNTELRSFLSSVLSKHYAVLEAENGREAMSLLPDCSPDLIISDVMMPEMNGLELAKAIKQDINTSHIPLVLLTAKSDIESKIEAMECGVDDYITKPFSSVYLEARVENLLKLRTHLQDYYRSSLTSGVISVSKPNVTSQDDHFIQRIMNYIEENMDDPDLSIDGVAAHIGLSRSTMFKKIKSLTGLAPVDFIKEIRLQRSVQLIETGEFNMSQISYMIGISDPRYFSKCFKLKYGMSPSEYKEKCQKG
jgi:Signal transduction histidine kinase